MDKRLYPAGLIGRLGILLLLIGGVIGCTDEAATPTAVSYPPPLAEVTAVTPPATLPYPAYPVITPTITAQASATPMPPPTATLTADLFMPIISLTEPTATPAPPPTATPLPAADFAAARAQLQANGQDLAYVPIGFHVGINGNWDGLVEYMTALDAAGVPFFLKTADNAEPIFIAQELMKKSGVPHVLVYRRAAGGDYYNVPSYDLPPREAAELHWQRHIESFPPELDPSLVWLETINEPDKVRSDWLAEFALHTAELALRDGYKWAAFGWASGEPEPDDWQSPAMLAFLRLVGTHPEQLAIALHEYSYLVDDIGHEYPFKIGRFQSLLAICDQYGIPRPTILITEWGWTYENVPEPEAALRDIDWASRLYSHYPEVKGAAIWFLGGGDTFSDIAEETQRLILPLRDFALQTYYARPAANPVPITPEQFAP